MKSKTFIHSLYYAVRGIVYTISTQRNMKIHLVIGGSVIAFSVYLGLSQVDFAVILIVISLVLVSELLNTSIEILLDIVKKDYDEDVKHVKDIQAGAVLVFSIFSVFVGILILWPYIQRFLGK